MVTVGYVYVGPLEHNAEFQRDLLRHGGASRIFEDVSLKTAPRSRSELAVALDALAPGDRLLVWRLDRLGSTTASVLSLLQVLTHRGIGVVSLAEEFATTGPDGAAVRAAITAFTELERSLARERSLVSAYAAKARGRASGRPRALSPTDIERVAALRDQGASVREIAEELGTSRATVYRVLESAAVEPDGPGAEERSITVTFGSPLTARELPSDG
ncbi:recombinase family protein [Microbacterium sp. CJ88]|uniref:recombinase family protein n=1 Tax=Microbacterium sp. CJ88 TaxID=3445672 RepID=UPI003F65CFB2